MQIVVLGTGPCYYVHFIAKEISEEAFTSKVLLKSRKKYLPSPSQCAPHIHDDRSVSQAAVVHQRRCDSVHARLRHGAIYAANTLPSADFSLRMKKWFHAGVVNHQIAQDSIFYVHAVVKPDARLV